MKNPSKKIEAELKKLKGRMEKLRNFLNSTKSLDLGAYERHLLCKQYFAMSNYSNVLEDQLSYMTQQGSRVF